MSTNKTVFRLFCVGASFLILPSCLGTNDVSGTLGSQLPTTPVGSTPTSSTWARQLGTGASVPGGDASQWEACEAITVDSSGNVYCAGQTAGSLGEAEGGSHNGDAFVAKFNSSGQMVWITQLGASTSVPGGDTSQADSCNGVAVDASGNVYCAGFTMGSLGEANGGLTDAFVMKLNSSGAVQWITQLGATTAVPGGSTAGSDYCWSVAVDNSGNVYCAGATGGALGEANGGGNDVFIMKLNPSGALQWITQLGNTTHGAGGDNTHNENCNSVAVDAAMNVYCAGTTTGAVGEAFGGGMDAMVIKLNSAGAVQWITQFGAVTKAPGGDTSNTDYFNGVAVDSSGNVFAAGGTQGNFAETNGGVYGDAMVVKLNSAGALQWATQLGAVTKASGGDNSQDDVCMGVALDASGNIYCGGYTKGGMGEANAGDYDGFALKLNSSGALQWLRQFGATTKAYASGDNSGYESFFAVAADSAGNVYVAGEGDGNFADVNGGGNGDAIIAKIKSDGTFSY